MTLDSASAFNMTGCHGASMPLLSGDCAVSRRRRQTDQHRIPSRL